MVSSPLTLYTGLISVKYISLFVLLGYHDLYKNGRHSKRCACRIDGRSSATSLEKLFTKGKHQVVILD
jgi:hypothetical protein